MCSYKQAHVITRFQVACALELTYLPFKNVLFTEERLYYTAATQKCPLCSVCATYRIP
jgi:hypothetical protein